MSKESEKVITIEPDGTVLTLYADDLPELGRTENFRASDVEPEENGRGWYVRLRDIPENGKFAGHYIARHVPKREEAIRLEIQFIQENILGAS
jgi:hypothetical protein